jgi:hypothetical protein
MKHDFTTFTVEWDWKLTLNGEQTRISKPTPCTGLLSLPSAANLKLYALLICRK